MSSIIESGAMARTTQAFSEDNYSYRKGMEFEVEEYATAEQAEASHGYYMGSNNDDHYNVEVREDHIELVRSAQAMRARTLPTVADLARRIGSGMLGFDDEVEFDEADYSAQDGTLEIHGTTADGLRIWVDVKVLSVERADF